MVGQRFGKLVVLEIADERRLGHVMVKVQCDCGVVKLTKRSRILDGSTRSCGCHRKQMHNFVTGKWFTNHRVNQSRAAHHDNDKEKK